MTEQERRDESNRLADLAKWVRSLGTYSSGESGHFAGSGRNRTPVSSIEVEAAISELAEAWMSEHPDGDRAVPDSAGCEAADSSPKAVSWGPVCVSRVPESEWRTVRLLKGLWCRLFHARHLAVVQTDPAILVLKCSRCGDLRVTFDLRGVCDGGASPPPSSGG